ncbi:patatin-like phospholipase family protein [Ruegeria arenilitoris]|uniref:patatin-like phospholipase family protein n=1 Tax=Ruegeria arenilitoris TaxID=1173585 RepID=UPI00148056B9|nr:patatin-like phospholipase family protein [Ruegeria arenilitoris]
MGECDLIMKGGVTSGVVYPFAITEIAGSYRLRNIGGTSAGAIAATIAGAAEYRRQTGGGNEGFGDIEEIASELGKDLGSLFQPTPELKQPFEILKKLVTKDPNAPEGEDGKPKAKTGVLKAVLTTYRGRVFTAVLLAGAPAILSAMFGVWGFFLFFLLLIPVLAVVLIGLALKKAATVHLPAADFGLCSGKTQPDSQKPAFTNWIADHIDRVAGCDVTDTTPPLTIGDLEHVGINVATMTTDLSTQRPYKLPLTEKRFFVRRSEMERLFPKRVVEYLCQTANPPQHKDDPDDLFRLPVGPEFPLVLMARMSLSFPGLISAVPLWRVDYEKPKDENGKNPMTRLLFSDGGICSNFPVHFFDAPLPQRPTFGIKLGPYEEAIHTGERVDLPEKPRDVPRLRTSKVDGIGSFLFAILNTAKDWNDTLQSQLPGYAERIVEIRLRTSEGGMNFTMDPGVVSDIQEYGAHAGKKLVTAFKDEEQKGFNRHRYVRALSYAVAMEEALAGLTTAYTDNAANPTYPEVMAELDVGAFGRISKAERKEIVEPFLAKLSTLGLEVKNDEASAKTKTVKQAGGPAQDASLRLAAEADRRPEVVDSND